MYLHVIISKGVENTLHALIYSCLVQFPLLLVIKYDPVLIFALIEHSVLFIFIQSLAVCFFCLTHLDWILSLWLRGTLLWSLLPLGGLYLIDKEEIMLAHYIISLKLKNV